MGLSEPIKSYEILKRDINGSRLVKRRRRVEPVVVEIFHDGSVVVHARKRVSVVVLHRMSVQSGAAEILSEQIDLKGLSKKHRKIYGMIRATGNRKECHDVVSFIETEFKLQILRRLSDGSECAGIGSDQPVGGRGD